MNWVGLNLGLLVAYYLSARLSMWLLITPPEYYAAAVWPPAGIALAALLVFGKSLWPGLWLGYVLFSWHSFGDLGLAMMLGIGATAQALFGQYLLQRFNAYPNTLAQENAILRFFLLGGPLACVVSATGGVTVLSLQGVLHVEHFLLNWATWWVGDSIGVLLCTPLLILWLRHDQQQQERRMQVTLAMSIGLLLTSLLFFYASNLEAERLRSRFNSVSQALHGQLKEGFQLYLDILYDLKAFHHSSQKVEFQEFKYFVSYTLQRYPGIQALEWIPRIPHTQRESFEQALNLDGFSNTRLTQLAQANRTRTAAEAEEYFPIRYVQPYRGNEKALGYDIASNPKAWTALEQARDSGTLAVTQRTVLIQETQNAYGIVVYLPIYKSAVLPSELEAKREQLQGFMAAVFRVHDILPEILRDHQFQGLDIRLQDTRAPLDEQDLYDSRHHYPQTSGYRIAGYFDYPQHHYNLNPAGRDWLLHIAANDDFFQQYLNWQGWWILSGGLLFTALMGLFTFMVTGRNLLFKKLLDERTQELQEAQHIAERANHAKTEFIANMSHEIRTPMHAIQGFTDILQDQLHTAEQREYLQSIRNNAKSLMQLLSDVLDLAKAETGTLHLQYHPLQPQRVLREVAQLFHYAAQKKNIRIHLNIAQDIPDSLSLDETRLRQILLNLVGNAVKFTHQGRIDLSLWTHCSIAGNRLYFKVKDTGVGIATEQQEKIFQAFEHFKHTEDSASSAPPIQHQSRMGGTGLGLAITYKLVKMMQGDIELDSQPGQGSCFTVIFHQVRLTLEPLTLSNESNFNQEDANIFAAVRTTKNPQSIPHSHFYLPEKLQACLQQDYLIRCQALTASSSINEIDIFADSLKNLAEEHHNELLKEWASQLKWHIQQFNMEALWDMLAGFSNWLEEHSAGKHEQKLH